MDHCKRTPDRCNPDTIHFISTMIHFSLAIVFSQPVLQLWQIDMMKCRGYGAIKAGYDEITRRNGTITASNDSLQVNFDPFQPGNDPVHI
jgi:hypothetical protein